MSESADVISVRYRRDQRWRSGSAPIRLTIRFPIRFRAPQQRRPANAGGSMIVRHLHSSHFICMQICVQAEKRPSIWFTIFEPLIGLLLRSLPANSETRFRTHTAGTTTGSAERLTKRQMTLNKVEASHLTRLIFYK